MWTRIEAVSKIRRDDWEGFQSSKTRKGLYSKSGRLWVGSQNKKLCFIALTFALTLFYHNSALARYASIILDAQSGKVLHADNPDRQRYPASLTKMMTLYMLFDALEKGRVKLDRPMKASTRAAGMAPSKLGLHRGDTITVEQAILALITKSANDVAVVIAEDLGGTEIQFAKMMTEKAHALGMSKTRFANASGLPNRHQVSTARDMATLARRLIFDFPQFYHYFGTAEFQYQQRTYKNHNNLLNDYPGVDGIKTGYIRASGFNLVASTQRYGRRLIGVVLGGQSPESRDQRMRALFERAYAMVPKPKTDYPKTTAEAIEAQEQPLAPRPVHPVRVSTAAAREIPAATRDERTLDWAIQVGAFTEAAPARLAAYSSAGRLQGKGVTDHGRVAVVRHESEAEKLYRAQIVGMSQREAMTSCDYLRGQGQACLAIPPETQ